MIPPDASVESLKVLKIIVYYHIPHGIFKRKKFEKLIKSNLDFDNIKRPLLYNQYRKILDFNSWN